MLRDTGQFTPATYVSSAGSVVGGDDTVDADGNTVFNTDDVGAGGASASNDPLYCGLDSVD